MNENDKIIKQNQADTLKKFEERSSKCLKTLLIKSIENAKKKND